MRTPVPADHHPSQDGPVPDPVIPPACAACPHERDAHDRLGTRFCAATVAGDLRRGCICVGGTPASPPR